ncbi:hypothetical protein L7F22_034408 [Adiantum nelumboides]|nr:hypothetical protein [Adiantum nelumboides]
MPPRSRRPVRGRRRARRSCSRTRTRSGTSAGRRPVGCRLRDGRRADPGPHGRWRRWPPAGRPRHRETRRRRARARAEEGMAADAPLGLDRARRPRARPDPGVRDRLGGLHRAPRRGHRRVPGRQLHVRGRIAAGDRATGQRQPDQRDAGPGPATGAAGRALGGGPLVLLQPRLRHQRYRPRGVEPAQRRHRRRLDDHPAVHQGDDGAGPVLAVPQVPGGRARREDLQGVHEAADPGELPQRDLPGSRVVRHPGGQPGLLRQERAGPQRLRGRHDRGTDPVPVAVGPGEEPGPLHPALELRPRRDGRAGLAEPRRPGEADLPAVEGGLQDRGGHPRGRPRTRLQPGARRAREARDHRPGDQHPGPDRQHHDRPEGPGGRGHRGPEGDGGPAGQPALVAGVGGPEDRCDPRLLRRRERCRDRLRRRAQAARLVVQAVRAGRGAAGAEPDRARHDLRRLLAADPRRHGGRELRGRELRAVLGEDGDDEVDQHRVLPDGPRHRSGEGGRRRAPGRHPGRPAAQPHRRHLAG